MIELSNLNKSYSSGLVALTDINLSIRSGEIFGVIGPSGAGKSTLIRCVNLLEMPSSGKVIVADQELTKLPETELRRARKKIGMIFQNFNLLTTRTVFENIALPLEISGVKKSKILQTVTPLLSFTGLTDKKDFYPSQLSGGQKQRVAIARALANKPKVLLSDEATSALDPQTTHSILQLLKNINQQFGVTVLLITHEMEVIKETCHRLAILEQGTIIETAEVLEFFSNPKTDIAKQFLRLSLREKLPQAIKERLLSAKIPDCDVLLRFSFLGHTAEEPLIANVIKNFSIEINILQANIEVIRNQTMGTMIVQVSGTENKLQQGIEYLKSKNVNLEIIGYVKRSF
jgi:D-methionine transport system ATP-binding protein